MEPRSALLHNLWARDAWETHLSDLSLFASWEKQTAAVDVNTWGKIRLDPTGSTIVTTTGLLHTAWVPLMAATNSILPAPWLSSSSADPSSLTEMLQAAKFKS